MKQAAKKRLILAFLAAFLCVGIAGMLILQRALHLDNYKDQILAEVQSALNRQVRYGKGEVTLGLRPAFTFSDVTVLEKDGKEPFIRAGRLRITVALLPLLEKKLVLKDFILDSPFIHLVRNSDGSFNINDLLERKPGATPLQLNALRVTEGDLLFTDRKVSSEPVETRLEELNLSCSTLTRGKKSTVSIDALLRGNGSEIGHIAADGTMRFAKEGQPATDTTADLRVSVKNLDSSHFWPYYAPYVPFNKPLGHLSLDGSFKGALKEFASRGSVRIAGLRFDYPSIFHAVLTPRDFFFSYDLRLDKNAVDVKSLDLTVDALNVKGGCEIRDISSGDPRIIAHAVTSSFRLEDFRRYIPYGVIARDTSEFIERYVLGGTYRLTEGRLDGRASQIAHMERGDNNKVLYIHARADRGLLSFGGKVPTFNGIKGELELSGKNFNQIHMSGNFGVSPFTLEGRIADYCMDTPSAYPFSMNIVPHSPEVAWLAAQGGADRLSFGGSSTLHLTGSGFSNEYFLAGDWNLTAAAYTYPDLIAKPAGHANSLTFKGAILRNGFRVSELSYSLAPLAANASGAFKSGAKPRLDFDVRTNSFAINEVAPMLTGIKGYQPKGKIQAALHAGGEPKSVADMAWSGTVSMTGASFKPSATIKPVTDINGTVRFKGNSFESSLLAVKIGTTPLYGKGSMNGFKNPSLILAFSSPAVDPADFGFKPQPEMHIENVKGSLSLRNNDIQIRSLALQVNDTLLKIRGKVEDIRNPKAEIAVTSPRLNTADILLLAGLEKGGNEQSKLALKATIEAESGIFWRAPYRNLKAAVEYGDKIVYLQPVDFSTLGGRFSGKGRIDLGTVGSQRYQMTCSLNKVSADQFMQVLGVQKQEITGTLNLQADLTAKGETAAELKKSALGQVKLHFRDGSLRRFATLSKVFSILNVSQLLKFQLPDMVSGGMPYNQINATLAFRDGIASTKDLFVDSDAMNISMVGKADLIKEEIDLTIGVQPLQTVDKVVNRIPIVGWILTGKDKSVISSYFEAKGSWNNPQVSAIPVKSIAKGVFDIFKRVFQLPAKLFTDTGEVMMGK